MSRPPVAWTRSAWVMRYCAAGMLGRPRHWRRSGGAPSRASARRMISTVSMRRPLAARVRREHDGVAALDREDADAGRRQLGVGRGHERGDEPDRLGVLDDALLGQLLDDPDARLAEDVAQDAHDLEALADPRHGVADAALLDAHVGQPREGGLVGDRPADGLAEPVDLLLRGALELAKRGPAAGHERRRRQPSPQG